MQDNESLALKLEVRNAALKHLGKKPNLVLDMFAGEGVISKMLWCGISDHVICIEKDAKKASKITNKAQVIIGDNSESINLAENAEIIDCDAYGMVMDLIKKLPKNKIVVFTDGTPMKAKRIFNAEMEFQKNLKLLFSHVFVKKNLSGTAYYGWGVTK